MFGGQKRQTKTNLLLWIAVSMISIISLGVSVYKANTGEELQWLPVVGEVCVLLAAGCFIYAYFRGHKSDKNRE